jgi:hypothetical protein
MKTKTNIKAGIDSKDNKRKQLRVITVSGLTMSAL